LSSGKDGAATEEEEKKIFSSSLSNRRGESINLNGVGKEDLKPNLKNGNSGN